MATIGKDGKDDGARLAADRLGIPPFGLRVSPELSYFRLDIVGLSQVTGRVLVENYQALRDAERGGRVDSYGSVDENTGFVVFAAVNEDEAEQFARTLPVAQSRDVDVSVARLDI